MAEGFRPPPYPYDRLAPLHAAALAHPDGIVDLSVGTPCDPPPDVVAHALGDVGAARGYPPSIGVAALRETASAWMARRLGVRVDPETEIATCIGTKELVAGLPHWLSLRDPSRDTVLYPAVSYPTYAMGATLAGCRAVPVPLDAQWRLDLDAIEPGDAARALCVWVNTPGNPAGGLDDLAAVAAWGRAHDVVVVSDECYVEFTWDGPARTVLAEGAAGVLAVHSLSKRSNLAGARIGFYAGDADLVGYLREVRKHAGLMPPGPEQVAAVAALADDAHVDAQRERYRWRLQRLARAFDSIGVPVALPGGGFYLWVAAPGGDAWGFATMLAERHGVLVSPGEFYGDQGSGHIRLAMVAPDERIDAVAERLSEGIG